MVLCFATNNSDKINEIARLVHKDFNIVSLDEIGCTEEIPELFPTIAENSYAKADYIFRNYHIDCFADDTGLEVDALGGEPGVHSARFAGPGRNSQDNIDLLLQKMLGIKDRSARFRTVITLVIKDQYFQFEGIIEGSITAAGRGTHGFGYDPVFLPLGSDLTFAEMTVDKKNQISHRAIATRKLIDLLNSNTPVDPGL